jgi:tRNA-binding protein
METATDSADFSNFLNLDIRIGTIVAVERAKTNKPTYRMTIDFGESLGTKVSCGAYTNYEPSALIGKQIVAVVNFAAKRMGPELSEALVLGVNNPHGEGTVPLTLDQPTPNGLKIF